MVNAQSTTYLHMTFFSTSETNYLPWVLLTMTSSMTTRFLSTSSSPILPWLLSPWKPIGSWISWSTVSHVICCFSHSLDLVRKLGWHLLNHGFQSLIYPALFGLTSLSSWSKPAQNMLRRTSSGLLGMVAWLHQRVSSLHLQSYTDSTGSWWVL